MRKQMISITLRFFMAWILMSSVAGAQTNTGVISGRVVDPTGLALANAQVTLTDDRTGETWVSATGDTGDFVFASVKPGRFTLVVEAPGFKRFQKTNIILTANERLSAGTLELEVGVLTESITVMAEVTPVQTTSQERSALLSDRQIATLMTRGRDFLSLLRVLPGVVGLEGGGGEALGVLSSPTIYGVRDDYNALTIDGVMGNTRGLGNLDTPLNLDAIAEVKVLQGNYQAEYGKTAGAHINAVTKSGTREFHGTAYFYKRHEQFNANSFFNNQLGLPKARYRYTTIGYNIGGPISWPGKFNQKEGQALLLFLPGDSAQQATRRHPVLYCPHRSRATR